MNWTDGLTGSGVFNGIILGLLTAGIIIGLLAFIEIRKQRRLGILPKIVLSIPKYILYYAPNPDEVYQESNYLSFDLQNIGGGAAENIKVRYHFNRRFLEDCRWCRLHNSRVTLRMKHSETRTYSLTEKSSYDRPLLQNEKLEIMPEKLNRLLYAVWAQYLKKGMELPAFIKIMDVEIEYNDILRGIYKSSYQILMVNEENLPAYTDALDGAFLSYRAVAGGRKAK